MDKSLFKLVNSLLNLKSDEVLDMITDHFKSNGLGEIKVDINENQVEVTFDKKLKDETTKYVVENLIVRHLQEEKIRELKILSETDDVTSFFNQRKLYSDLDFLISKNKKKKNVFSVMFVDVDKFKFVNDQFGHLIGSKMLEDIANIIRSKVETKYLYRYGGDEFVLFIDGKGGKEVFDIGQSICDEIKDHVFDIEGHGDFKLSVSIGICQYPDDAKTYKEIIELADKMMYESKKQGRGRVVQYQHDQSHEKSEVS